MNLIFPLIKSYASRIKTQNSKALENQEIVFKKLIKKGQNTLFGKHYNFDKIKTYEEFRDTVPIHDYEALKPYITQIKQGVKDVLWKGLPLCFAKTSGTTSGIKYIPITRDSLPSHIKTARKALILYVAESGNTQFLNGKMIFLSGSPELDYSGIIPYGRLSGIINNYVPKFYKKRQLPSYDTNCITNWEQKLDKIIEETAPQNMTLISGIPPWVQMYFERLLLKTKHHNIKQIFPNFSVFVYGGVNFKPYKKILENYIGTSVDSIETYPASEGFIAYQDTQHEEGLLLNTNAGIFFEFVEYQSTININERRRCSLKDVKIGINYIILLSTNAGMWTYNIGDTIKFVNLKPYRIVVTGRIKHFISTFGEHVIAEEVEHVMKEIIKKMNLLIKEFTVAPYISPQGAKSYHEWFIEFDQQPDDINSVALEIDKALCNKNIYYQDLIQGSILQKARIVAIQKGGFINCMKDIGKLGEQNKVPHLSNDRDFVTHLLKYKR